MFNKKNRVNEMKTEAYYCRFLKILTIFIEFLCVGNSTYYFFQSNCEKFADIVLSVHIKYIT